MKKIKFQWLYCLVIALFLLIGSTVAYAALIDQDEKTNRFQIGNLETKIIELEPTQSKDLKPGNQIEQTFSIENVGTVKQFVRVMVHPVVSVKENGEIRLLPSDVVNVGVDFDDFQFNKNDGYYYYIRALSVGKTDDTDADADTVLMIRGMSLKEGLSDEYNQADVTLNVKVEAVAAVESSLTDVWHLEKGEWYYETLIASIKNN